MTQCSNHILSNSHFVTYGAVLTLGQTGILTISGNSGVDHFSVTQCGDLFATLFCLSTASDTGGDLSAGLGAGSGCGDHLITVAGDIPLAGILIVGISAGNAGSYIGAVSILQYACLDGNIYKFNILLGAEETGGLCLNGIVNHSLVAGLQVDNTVAHGVDVCAAGGAVNIAVFSMDGAVDLNQGIVSSAYDAVAARHILDLQINVVCSAAVTQLGARIVIVDPLVVVIYHDAVTGTQCTAGALIDIQLGAGQQNQILIHQDIALNHSDIHVVGNGQIIVGGVNGGVLSNTGLHGNGNIGNGNIAVDLHIQTAGAFQIVLDNVAVFNNEHGIVGADEGDRCALQTDQGNAHSKVAGFNSTCMDGQGNLNILDIVLGKGEYPVGLAADNLSGAVAAAEVRNLEGLIDSTAA